MKKLLALLLLAPLLAFAQGIPPNCTDTGGQHLNYTVATHAWSCGTSVSGGVAIGGAISGGTATRILYEGAGPVLADSANFTWDNTNQFLGIGPIAPASSIQATVDGSGSYFAAGTYRNSAFAGGFIIGHARGTVASPTYLNSGDRVGSIFFNGYDGSDPNVLAQSRNSASLEVFADGTQSSGVVPGRMVFSTHDNTSSGTMLTRLRIDSAGMVTIANSSGTFPTASGMLTLPAGSTAASTAPIKLTSGSLMTTAEAGAVEFLTDSFYSTITTGAARKEIVLADSALTSGRLPVVTTNGRLVNNVAIQTTAPTLASGGCTNAALSNNNGTAHFTAAVGTGCSGSQPLVFTLPAATNGWNCYARNATNAATIQPAHSSVVSTTSVTITAYSRTLGTAVAWNDNDVVVVSCLGG